MINLDIINSRTKTNIMQYKHVPQSMIVYGQKGLGKQFIALKWIESHGAKKSNITFVENEGIINVEQIRELYKFTKGKRSEDHFIIIKDAETMNTSAQNAFLKLLEEPIDNIHFILLVNNLDSILQTIQSRAQKIEVLPVSKEMVANFINDTYNLSKSQSEQILFMSDGKIGKAIKLASDEEYFKNLSILTKTAKLYLTSSAFQKIIIASDIAKNREECLYFLDALMNMIERLILISDEKQKWLESLEKCIKTAQNIKENGNTKTQMTNLSIGI